MKIIDIKESVYQICSHDPEVVSILEEIGFTDITKPGMLSTVGRFMTLDKGAKMKNIHMDRIETVFMEHGFQIMKEES